MKAKIVLGSQWGDEGKGTTVNYLCKKNVDPIVVRFSGGPQAGHNVVLDDKRHVHSSYGSGAISGYPSYISEHCVVYPPSIAREHAVFVSKGVTPKLFVHPLAMLITEYDIAYNRMTEKINGHGSCGKGIAATMKRHLESPYKLFAIDLTYPEILEVKLGSILNWYLQKVNDERMSVLLFIEECRKIREPKEVNYKDYFNITGYLHLNNYSNIIFEGSQGIMLDMDHGTFPNVTYANTTCKNAVEICAKLGIDYEVYYVTRCYQTRHGAGWMSSTKSIELINTEEEINVLNDFQGYFKVKELDYNSLNYAIQVDSIYQKPKTLQHLVVTCMDQRPGFIFDPKNLEAPFETILFSNSANNKDFKTFYEENLHI